MNSALSLSLARARLTHHKYTDVYASLLKKTGVETDIEKLRARHVRAERETLFAWVKGQGAPAHAYARRAHKVYERTGAIWPPYEEIRNCASPDDVDVAYTKPLDWNALSQTAAVVRRENLSI